MHVKSGAKTGHTHNYKCLTKCYVALKITNTEKNKMSELYVAILTEKESRGSGHYK